jgi:hypothetical protein
LVDVSLLNGHENPQKHEGHGIMEETSGAS